MFFLTTLVLLQTGYAGLKDNIVRNLVNQDRYAEAHEQCDKWQRRYQDSKNLQYTFAMLVRLHFGH